MKGFKDVLLGKVSISPDRKQLNLRKEDDKKKRKVCDSIKLAYETLILLIDRETSTGHLSFSIVRKCKISELAGSDMALAWKRLRDKFKPKLAPS